MATLVALFHFPLVVPRLDPLEPSNLKEEEGMDEEEGSEERAREEEYRIPGNFCSVII